MNTQDAQHFYENSSTIWHLHGSLYCSSHVHGVAEVLLVVTGQKRAWNLTSLLNNLMVKIASVTKDLLFE